MVGERGAKKDQGISASCLMACFLQELDVEHGVW